MVLQPIKQGVSTGLVLLPFIATIHEERKQQLPKGFLPSGQASMPKLINTVNLTFTLTSLETLGLTATKQKNKEKLCND